MNRFVNHVVRAHSYRTSRVILAELAFLGSLAALIWVVILIWPQCELAEFIAYLGIIQMFPVLFLCGIMMNSAIVTPRAQRIIVRRRDDSIEVRIPVGYYLIFGVSLVVASVSLELSSG